MGEIRAFSKRQKWTQAEIELLTERYAIISREELAKLFPTRALRSIESKANWLGLSRPKRLPRTPDQIRAAKRESMARRRAADPDKARAYRNAYHADNREAQTEKMSAYYAKRFFWGKAMKLRGTDRATAQDLAVIWKRQRGLCALTGRRLDRTAQLDHKHPKTRGGSDSPANLQWLCEEANLAKRALTDAEFVALCGDVMRWIGERIQQFEALTDQTNRSTK